MNKIKLFLLEDNDQEIQLFKDACGILLKTQKVEVELVPAKNCKDSLESLDNSFDGAIIDLKIGADGSAGNEIAKKIIEDYKIPAIIFTGTPAASEMDSSKIPVFTKGSDDCDKVIMYFDSIYNTGITKIFGDRGHINSIMKSLFWNTLIPNIKNWEQHSCTNEDKEKSLIKVTINHLQELIDNEFDFVLSEEMYVKGPSKIKTGAVVKFKTQLYVVVTPACDLEIRNGGAPNTSRVLLCEIEEQEKLLKEAVGTKTAEKEIKNVLLDYMKNKKSTYYHWLPQFNDFKGGFMNFRHIITVPWAEFSAGAEVQFQVSQSFTKDIVGRLSSFYSRQGQPDFAWDYHANNLYETSFKPAAAPVPTGSPSKPKGK